MKSQIIHHGVQRAGEEDGSFIHHSRSHQYRCNYRDVKQFRRPEIEFIEADSVSGAFRIFINHRHDEDWTIPQIFSHSLLEIIDEETDEKYIVNKFGEIVRWDTVAPI